MSTRERLLVAVAVFLAGMYAGVRLLESPPDVDARAAQRAQLATKTENVDSMRAAFERWRDSLATIDRRRVLRETALKRSTDSLRMRNDSIANAAALATTAADSAEAFRLAFLGERERSDSLERLVASKDERIASFVADSARSRLLVDSLVDLDRGRREFQARLERDLKNAERRPTWRHAIATVVKVEAVVVGLDMLRRKVVQASGR